MITLLNSQTHPSIQKSGKHPILSKITSHPIKEEEYTPIHAVKSVRFFKSIFLFQIMVNYFHPRSGTVTIGDDSTARGGKEYLFKSPIRVNELENLKFIFRK